MSLTGKKPLTLQKVLPYIFMVAGILGMIASFALTYDKIQVLKDPSYAPNCNINPIFSCVSIMKSEQSNLFGVPNTIFGLIGFTALTVIGVLLLTGSKLHKKLWVFINVVALMGFGFFMYLFFQGVYRLNAICPYCFAIWMITPPVLWYTTLYNLRERNIKMGLNQRIKAFLARHHADILIAWYLLIFTLLLTHFWYYWETLI